MLILTDRQPRGAGYLEIDQRNVEVALPPGVQRYFEAETYTCSHCQVVVVLTPSRTRERYKCAGCNHHVCDPCAADRVAGAPCKTYQQKVEESMARELRQPEPSQHLILP